MSTVNTNIRESDFTTLLKEIYSKKPKNFGENKVILLPEKDTDLDNTSNYDYIVFTFQMLLEFYLEGFCHYNKLCIIKNNYDIDTEKIKEFIKNNIYDNLIYKDINMDLLYIPEDWIKSIGFVTHIIEEDYEFYKENINDSSLKKDYELGNHYCKIILDSNPKDNLYFSYMKINKPYHCLLNADFNKNKINNFEDMYAILIKNNSKNAHENKVYKIYFNSISLVN